MARVLQQPLFWQPRRVYPNGTIRHAMTFCTICGRTGLPGGRWQEPCYEHPDHPHRCSCGRRYPSRGALAAHVRIEARWRPQDRHEKIAS